MKQDCCISWISVVSETWNSSLLQSMFQFWEGSGFSLSAVNPVNSVILLRMKQGTDLLRSELIKH